MKRVMAGDYKEARTLFKKAGKLNPDYRDHLEIIKNQGLADIKKGKLESASKKLGMVVTSNVGDVLLHKQIIDAGIKSKNLTYIYNLYNNLVAEHPFNPTLRKTLPDFYYGQAQKHKKSGKNERALYELQIVKILQPNYKGVGVDNQIKALKRKVKK